MALWGTRILRKAYSERNFDNTEININIQNLNFINTEINIEIHLISVPNPGSMYFKVNMRVSLLNNALNMHIRDCNL